MAPIPLRDRLQFARHRNHTGVDDRLLRRGAERGVLVRVRRGVYVDAAAWSALAPADQQRLVAAAALDRASSEVVASHRSAAALLGIPTIRPPTGVVDVLIGRATGSRTEHGFRKHAVDDPFAQVLRCEGLAMTPPARTVVDLAFTEPFVDAVVAADWVLAHGVTREQLQAALDSASARAGRARAQRVIDFADARAGSPGESVSRVLIRELGFPPPDLQVPFADGEGFIGFVDFYWADCAVIGEFDGRVKYADPALLKGRRPEEVVIAEKRREDRLRAVGPRVARWVWGDLNPPERLARVLASAGVPTVDRRFAA